MTFLPLWYSLTMVIVFLKCSCGYLGLPRTSNGGRMTFLPDLISSRLLAVVESSKPTIRVISGQEATCQCAAGMVLANCHVFGVFEDSEESTKGAFLHSYCCCSLWNLYGWLEESVCGLLPESDTFPNVVVVIL